MQLLWHDEASQPASKQAINACLYVDAAVSVASILFTDSNLIHMVWYGLSVFLSLHMSVVPSFMLLIYRYTFELCIYNFDI